MPKFYSIALGSLVSVFFCSGTARIQAQTAFLDFNVDRLEYTNNF